MKSVATIQPNRNGQAECKALRVAAYCRVSTGHEEQDGSIEAQELHYFRMIHEHPGWENAGIFTDRGSGMNLNDRSAFQELMRRCERDEIDLVLVKSVSRFGRNTVDMLKALRTFHAHGVDVFFEKENLWLHEKEMQLLVEAYCAFAQAESEEMSRSIRWGVKRGFERGTSGYVDFVCYGYKRGDGGVLAIDEPDAAVVRTIFEMRADGKSLGAISDCLYASRVPSPTGRERWSRETISKLLRNEKYIGSVLLQKTYGTDVLTGKRAKNHGELPRYLIEQHHPAIVSKELFEAANKPAKKQISDRWQKNRYALWQKAWRQV